MEAETMKPRNGGNYLSLGCYDQARPAGHIAATAELSIPYSRAMDRNRQCTVCRKPQVWPAMMYLGR